jgi:hypothetical protein
MRLGQLARKLSLRPNQIVEFLAKRNIQIEEGSNTRLEESHIALVVEKFAPAGFEALLDEEIQQVTSPESVATTDSHTDKIETIFTPVTEPVQDTLQEEAKPEVIKVPKVELSGLKVLGKIDLPEQKKKEPQPALVQNDNEKEIKPQEKTRPQRIKSTATSARPSKNPIALQREREELEVQRQREAARALEKEKKAQHYFNKVKVVAPVKTSKREQVEEEISTPDPEPKTLLGKFFRWFTT